MTTSIPDGYKKNSVGHLVPVEKIEAIDLLRDELVKKLVTKSELLNTQLKEFRILALKEIAEFIELSADQYGINIGGKKGNVSLSSFDGVFTIKRSVNENISFDERLQVAKELVDDCIHRWSQGSNDNIKALVEHAFQTDKEGNISVTRILGLRKLDIKDDVWREAMEAIADSLTITGSKTYLRVYKRNEDESSELISLDLATA